MVTGSFVGISPVQMPATRGHGPAVVTPSGSETAGSSMHFCATPFSGPTAPWLKPENAMHASGTPPVESVY